VYKKLDREINQLNYREIKMATLAEIRAKLKQAEQRGSETTQRFGGDNSVYPFWNIKEGDESVIRFLPDGDVNNTFFWVERAMIKLPFAGIKGESESKEVTVQVPCVEMYNDGSVCPILSEVRAWFKDPALEDMGRKYWKKRSFIFQGFVTEDGLQEKEKPENPIRRFIIGPQIFTLIKAALVDPELEDMPTDYVNGLDFRLKKGSKGSYADYSTSNWSRRTRPLSAIEQAAVDANGLYNLTDFLPKKPGAVELKIIKEMFEASVDGEAYDAERWGQYFKPAGLNQSTGDPSQSNNATPAYVKPVIESASAEYSIPVSTETSAPVAEAVPASGDNRANDILAMIRSRNQAQ
jgi:hypothetical protein